MEAAAHVDGPAVFESQIGSKNRTAGLETETGGDKTERVTVGTEEDGGSCTR